MQNTHAQLGKHVFFEAFYKKYFVKCFKSKQTIELLYLDIQRDNHCAQMDQKRYLVRNAYLRYVVIYRIRKNKRSFKHRWQRRRKKRNARKKRMMLRVK